MGNGTIVLTAIHHCAMEGVWLHISLGSSFLAQFAERNKIVASDVVPVITLREAVSIAVLGSVFV